jgi:hypothetical protein
LQLQVLDLELRGFSCAGTCVVQEQQQRVITHSLRRLQIRCCQERVHFWFLEIGDLRASKLPERYRQNTARPLQVFRPILADETRKGMHGCEPLIDGSRAHKLAGCQRRQKPVYQLPADIINIEQIWTLTQFVRSMAD